MAPRQPALRGKYSVYARTPHTPLYEFLRSFGRGWGLPQRSSRYLMFCLTRLLESLVSNCTCFFMYVFLSNESPRRMHDGMAGMGWGVAPVASGREDFRVPQSGPHQWSSCPPGGRAHPSRAPSSNGTLLDGTLLDGGPCLKDLVMSHVLFDDKPMEVLPPCGPVGG